MDASPGDPGPPVAGVRLTRTEENLAEVDALAALLGGRTGVAPVLGDLHRQGRRTLPWGRAVVRSFTWDAEDRRTTQWYPQGITTSADADDSERVHGKALVVAAWYLKDEHGGNQGSRVTFVDLQTLRYRHVLLVQPRLRKGRLVLSPLKVHAGGIVWRGPYLHVAATSKGFVTCHVDDVMRIPDERAADRGGAHLRRLGVQGDEVASLGYRYVLPVRFAYQAYADEGHQRMKYSFLSLDRADDPPAIVAGEYARGDEATRLARYPLDPLTSLLVGGADGTSRPVALDTGGVTSMQGACVARGRHHVTVSHGPWMPGSVYSGSPGALRRHRFALPMGPEDISYWPSADLLWSLTEHPRRRWVVAMRRSFFD
ncbi:hypothetical protein [Nocardioides bigeumensis]|uniref:Uncharacterized protein n=1 Tax=Nocardioides bigeumensis TaxID=433657 RepID=A0ABN2Y2G9_9ACTN